MDVCRTMVQFLMGAGNFFLFQSVQTSSGTHPHAYSMNRHFAQDHSGWFVRLTTHPHLVLRLRIGGAIP